jgi:hypothetical protein
MIFHYIYLKIVIAIQQVIGKIILAEGRLNIFFMHNYLLIHRRVNFC